MSCPMLHWPKLRWQNKGEGISWFILRHDCHDYNSNEELGSQWQSNGNA